MATVKKAATSKKAAKKSVSAAKPAVKKAAVKKKAARVVVKKKAARVAVKKKVARVTRKKVASKPASSAAAKTKGLRDAIAALKVEVRALKSDLKSAKARGDALSGMSAKRDVAVGKFLSAWDKKAMAALAKSAKPKRKAKARK